MSNNPDELRVYELASKIPGVSARLATAEEDCGYRKSDVIMTKANKTYYVQVSYSQKSKREREKLGKRGTFPIHTHKFKDMPLSDSEIISELENILE